MDGGAEEQVPPLPDEVRIVRAVLNEFKRSLLSVLDSEDTPDVQSFENVNVVVERIQQLGNIVLHVLQRKDIRTFPNYDDEILSVLDPFEENGVKLDSLPDPIRDQCIYYVKNDVFTYPFDLNTKHIDSLKMSS